jgi:hypothetical protein
MRVEGFNEFSGRTSESAAIAKLLAYVKVTNPVTGRSLSEPLCFGIAGGIGAGYSFCPSVIRHGTGGSGVSIVGRHVVYSTTGAWYRDAFDRLGVPYRVTETTAEAKALANLKAEIADGRPAVTFCGWHNLACLGGLESSNGLWMHTFIVYEIDEAAGVARVSDRQPTPVTLTLPELAAARAQVCTHKNRTLTIEAPRSLDERRFRDAIRDGIRACTREMLEGKMKTFSLPGLEILAKAIANDKAANGWIKVFFPNLVYTALRDFFDSIETMGTDTGLFRHLFADFLDEAKTLIDAPDLAGLASQYRALGTRWTELAEAALPNRLEPFKKTKALLRKRTKLVETKGEKARSAIRDILAELQTIKTEMGKAFPLDLRATRELLESLRNQITAIHADEVAAAEQLRAVVAAPVTSRQVAIDRSRH